MFQNLTVVAITGTSAYTQGSMFAVERSCRELPGSQGLLISPELPDNLPKSIRHVACKPFGYLEYNLFVIYMLHQFIETDYCLLVQNDGWVLNGRNWRDEFWAYDFIGAPLPLLGFSDGINWRLDGTDIWQQHQHLLNQAGYFEPQNGGFSLRSKKLLKLPSELGVNWSVSPPLPADGEPIAMKWQLPTHHEDVFLTAHCRSLLEQHGIRFAPPLVGTRFAMESGFINQMRDIPLNQILGAHWMQSMVLTGVNRVAINVDNPLLGEWMQSQGYEIESNLI